VLRGKSIVVTGSTRGIGKVVAIELAAQGAQVVVVGRNRDRGEKVIAEIESTGGTAVLLPCDLSIEEEVARLFDDVLARFGALHGVVNNAAETDIVSRDKPIADQPTEDFDHFMKANVYSVFWCFKYGIRAMLPAGGSFVTMSSVESITPRGGEPSYSTAKAAVSGLSRQVAVDYGDQGIRANTLVLGFIETNASRSLLADAHIGPIVRGVTGGAPPTSLDVARATAFLLSDDAQGFNAATITLDRGMTATGHVPSDLGIST
jgi:NAD(P)-dependent dehydrogenase (short-subunit alcohol dehydrogenase family)